MAKDWARAFYKSDAWQAARLAVLDRDNGLCVDCGRIASEVHHVQHLTPENISDPAVSLNPANLVSLCGGCHKRRHRRDRAAGRVQAVPDRRLCVFDSSGNPMRRP